MEKLPRISSLLVLFLQTVLVNCLSPAGDADSGWLPEGEGRVWESYSPLYELSTSFPIFNPFLHFPFCGPYILSLSETLGRHHFFLIGRPLVDIEVSDLSTLHCQLLFLFSFFQKTIVSLLLSFLFSSLF